MPSTQVDLLVLQLHLDSYTVQLITIIGHKVKLTAFGITNTPFYKRQKIIVSRKKKIQHLLALFKT